MTSKTVLGVDPGLQGGMVALNSSGEIVAQKVMPLIESELDLKMLSQHLKDLVFFKGVSLVVLEKAGCRPGQSAQSGLKTGRNYGALEGMLAALSIPYVEVTPQKWTKELEPVAKASGLKPSERTKAIKARNRRVVGKLFPHADLRASPRCSVPHEGLVDALLIAHWGVRNS